jgi:preprotein translocase subunit SecF
MMNKDWTKNKDDKRESGRFDFIGLAKFFVPLSIGAVLFSLIYILAKDFNYGVDFAGGTEVQVQFGQPLDTSRVRKFMSELGYGNASIQSFETGNEFLIRLDPVKAANEREANTILNETIAKIKDGLTSTFQSEQPNIRRVDTVGPQVGSELKRNGVLAGFYSLLLILIYIGLRFDYKFAPGAVFCLFHDSIVILGVFAVSRWEMNVQIMAAVLTIIGYSLNDTIVVFDRIRENEKLYRDQSFRWVCNRSMNDVLARTILTSMTTFISVIIMWAFAGGVIKDFALTMAIGIIVGSYSTIYVATPLVILADKLEKSRNKV